MIEPTKEGIGRLQHDRIGDYRTWINDHPIPENYIEMKGQIIYRKDYPELFKRLETRYSLIDSFVVPDYRHANVTCILKVKELSHD